MPQINQLPDIFVSQLFWLALVFGFIYFGIGRGMVPKIQSTVEARDKKIADDLAAAQARASEADETEEAYRERMDASRGEALKVAQEAKQQAALDDREAAEGGRREDRREGRRGGGADPRRGRRRPREIEPVAAEAAQEMVAKLTGSKSSAKDAGRAVKAVLHG